MTLPELHLECVALAMPMRGPLRRVMFDALKSTAPATAWARTCAQTPLYDLTELDIEAIVSAFGSLSSALTAIGLRLHDGGLRATAWSGTGMQVRAVG